MDNRAKIARIIKTKFWKRTWFMVLSLIFFAPIGIFLIIRYKIRPYKKLKINHKRGLYALLIVYGLVWFGLVNGGGNVSQTPNSSPIVKKSTSQQSHEARALAGRESARQSVGKSVLTNSGISDADANAISDVATSISFRKISSSDQLANDNPNEVSYVLKNDDGTFNYTLASHVVLSVTDIDKQVVYENGQKNGDYIYTSDIDWIGIKDNTENIVKQALKAPSTAKFAGSFLDPFDKWTKGRTGNMVSLTSYVDSENSFGAMLRSQFVIRYRIEHKSYKPTYFNFDGQELLNKE